jgi:voltage-gated potassium channel
MPLATEATDFKTILIRLYHGSSRRSRIFRFGLLIFDICSILFFVIASTLETSPWIHGVEIFIALIIALDFLFRLWISPNRAKYMSELATWADIIVVTTLLAPLFFGNLIFLRVLRALRLLRSYHVLRDLRKTSPFFKKNEDIIQSVISLGVFIFVVTALVYVLQVRSNPLINNYIDALYFTVTTLTTTGFGDITLQGSAGRVLSIVIMVVGVALFLRLIQTIFRPHKIIYECPDCGLRRHETDAVHCKHCGRVLHIETEGNS